MTQDIEIRKPYEPVIHEKAQRVWVLKFQSRLECLGKIRHEFQVLARKATDPKEKRNHFNSAIKVNMMEAQANEKYQMGLGFYINLIQNVN